MPNPFYPLKWNCGLGIRPVIKHMLLLIAKRATLSNDFWLTTSSGTRIPNKMSSNVVEVPSCRVVGNSTVPLKQVPVRDWLLGRRFLRGLPSPGSSGPHNPEIALPSDSPATSLCQFLLKRELGLFEVFRSTMARDR